MLKDPRIDLHLNGLWYFNGEKHQTYKLAKAAADRYDQENPPAKEGAAVPPPAAVTMPAVFKLEGAEGYADGWYYLSGEAYIGPWESEENATIAAGKGITPESLGGIPAAPAGAPADPPPAPEPVTEAPAAPPVPADPPAATETSQGSLGFGPGETSGGPTQDPPAAAEEQKS